MLGSAPHSSTSLRKVGISLAVGGLSFAGLMFIRSNDPSLQGAALVIGSAGLLVGLAMYVIARQADSASKPQA